MWNISRPKDLPAIYLVDIKNSFFLIDGANCPTFFKVYLNSLGRWQECLAKNIGVTRCCITTIHMSVLQSWRNNFHPLVWVISNLSIRQVHLNFLCCSMPQNLINIIIKSCSKFGQDMNGIRWLVYGTHVPGQLVGYSGPCYLFVKWLK